MSSCCRSCTFWRIMIQSPQSGRCGSLYGEGRCPPRSYRSRTGWACSTKNRCTPRSRRGTPSRTTGSRWRSTARSSTSCAVSCWWKSRRGVSRPSSQAGEACCQPSRSTGLPHRDREVGHSFVRRRRRGRGTQEIPQTWSILELFRELVSFPHLISHPNFALEALLIQEEEVRQQGLARNWRRRGWGTVERRLVQVVERRLFVTPADLVGPDPRLTGGAVHQRRAGRRHPSATLAGAEDDLLPPGRRCDPEAGKQGKATRYVRARGRITEGRTWRVTPHHETETGPGVRAHTQDTSPGTKNGRKGDGPGTISRPIS